MILDTNALSAMADGDPNIDRILHDATEVAIPVIVLGEYRFGISQSRHRARYETWLLRAVHNCRVLSVDETTAGEYAYVRARLRQGGRPIPANDAWIAALALQHAMPILTRDQHFDLVPNVARIGW